MSAADGRDLAKTIEALARPLLLAFDVDGTLSPIVEDPAAARVPLQVAQDLQALSEVNRVFVALVTGRDLQSLQSMVEVPGAYRAVEHGAVLVRPNDVANTSLLSPQDQQKLADFEAWVRSHAVPRGAVLEVKRGSRALHVRGLSATRPDLAQTLLEEAERVALAAGLQPRHGRAVLEAELESGDKGTALAELARQTGAQGVVYAGDDLTDLPALEQAQRLGGLGLFVRSSERPNAPLGLGATLDGPAEVHALIAELRMAMSG